MVRFGIVALLGEGMNFLLYGLFLNLISKQHLFQLAIAGRLCIIRAFSHSRLTFRVQFNKRLPLGYMQIQLFRFGLAFQSALDLEQAGNGKW